MSKILPNIKGVTTQFQRHFGDPRLSSDKRLYTNVGAVKVYKKALGTTNLKKVKEKLKIVGVKTNKLTTSLPIKEKKIIEDLKALHKAGVLKESYETTLGKLRKEQYKEHSSLIRQERQTFQRLSKNIKDTLAYGDDDQHKFYSEGAKQAIKEYQEHNEAMLKTGKFGIPNYDIWKKQGSSTLGMRIRAIQDLKYRNVSAQKELKVLLVEAASIRKRSQNNVAILKKYGLVAIQKDRPDDEKTKTSSRIIKSDNKKEESKDKNTSTRPASPASGVALGQSAGPSPIELEMLKREEALSSPGTVVLGGDKLIDFEKKRQEKQKLLQEDDKITNMPKEDQRQIAFINQETGGVEIDHNNADEQLPKAA